MGTQHYYNEIDPYCAAWLQNLMDAGHIPAGDIDTRSIEDVRPDELRGYTQCHFFAGLGGWPLALAIAGWSPSRPVWTGSCPCQPFSAAGKRNGFADQRHLWPAWYHLIRHNRWWLQECKRSTTAIFGEQVASATDWVRLVRSDLEAVELAVGFMPIEAASAGADHKRDRFWFVADACGTGLAQRKRERERGVLREVGGESQGKDTSDDGSLMGDSNVFPSRPYTEEVSARESKLGRTSSNGAMADANQLGTGEGWEQRSGKFSGIGIDPKTRYGWIIGHDGKARRVEPGIRLLAHGVSGRMAIVRPGFEAEPPHPEALHWYSRIGALKALGNAIDPRPAAAFIRAYAEARGLSLASVREAA